MMVLQDLTIRVPRAKRSLPVHWQALRAWPVAPKQWDDYFLQDHNRRAIFARPYPDFRKFAADN
jgi:hypothetical protein